MKNELKKLINYKIFKGLSEEDIKLFIPLIEIKEFPKDQKIIEENESGDSLLFLLKVFNYSIPIQVLISFKKPIQSCHSFKSTHHPKVLWMMTCSKKKFQK